MTASFGNPVFPRALGLGTVAPLCKGTHRNNELVDKRDVDDNGVMTATTQLTQSLNIWFRENRTTGTELNRTDFASRSFEWLTADNNSRQTKLNDTNPNLPNHPY